jgi:hypothetical protein
MIFKDGLAVVGEKSPFHSWKDNERFRRLGITFKRLVAKVKEEVLYGRMGLWPDHNPVVRCGLQFEIAQNLIGLCPCGCNFVESTLAELPTFIVPSAQAIAPATAKDQAFPITLRKLLEPEWFEIEL